MASIRKRRDGATFKWQVRWSQDGKDTGETFDTAAGAVRFRGMVDAAGGRWPKGWVSGYGMVGAPVTTGTGLTLAQWFPRAIAARSGANPRTRDDYQRDFDRNVPGWLADKAIEEITREDVGRWLIELQGRLSPKSIHNTHSTVSSVMKDALSDNLVLRNPFAGQSRKVPLRHEEMCFLTPVEFLQFREQVAWRYRPFIDFLFTTGLRFGEATALKPQHVDLVGMRLNVVTAWKRQPGGEYLSQEPKTAKARRTISLTKKQVEMLEELIVPGQLIFRNNIGTRISQSTFHKDTWTPALARAGEAGFTKRPRPHDLRHSHAAYLLSIGQPMLAVSRRLGHASITTTNDRYGHLLPQVDLDLVAAMESIGY